MRNREERFVEILTRAKISRNRKKLKWGEIWRYLRDIMFDKFTTLNIICIYYYEYHNRVKT